MSYKKVIAFSIITGTITAILNLMPFLGGTSFQDIAIYVEAWILFALIIILNCQSAKEAAIKCFIFFLISQPLIYLIEAIFGSEGFSIFRYYPRWAIITILTIPGAMIAYQIKRNNWLSLLVLSIANCYLAYAIIYYISMMKIVFPRHLLSALFCLSLIIIFTYALLTKKIHRIVAIILVLITLVISSITLDIFKKEGTYEIDVYSNSYTYRLDNPDIVNISTEANKIKLTTKATGNTSLFIIDENGNEIEYVISVYGTDIFVSKMD